MRTISAMPRAEKRFIGATRILVSVVWQFGSSAAMRSPKALRQRMFASIRLRAWCPVQRYRDTPRRGAGWRAGSRSGARRCPPWVRGQCRAPSTLNATLARRPFAIAKRLCASAVHKQVQRPIGKPVGDLDGLGHLLATQGRSVRHGQSRIAIFRRLATIPVVCLSSSLNRTLIVRQNRIAASEKTAGRSEFPSGGARHAFCLSSQISSDPRLRSEAVQLDQFDARSRTGMACSSASSNRLDSGCESSTARVLLQCHRRTTGDAARIGTMRCAVRGDGFADGGMRQLHGDAWSGR